MIVKNVIDMGKKPRFRKKINKFFFLRQTTDLVGILEDRRHNLPEIDASVGKCLMLDRLIAYIRDVKIISKKRLFNFLCIKE